MLVPEGSTPRHGPRHGRGCDGAQSRHSTSPRQVEAFRFKVVLDMLAHEGCDRLGSRPLAEEPLEQPTHLCQRKAAP